MCAISTSYQCDTWITRETVRHSSLMHAGKHVKAACAPSYGASIPPSYETKNLVESKSVDTAYYIFFFRRPGFQRTSCTSTFCFIPKLTVSTASVSTQSLSAMSEEVHRLISIGVSHYCEKARWGLERAYIAFTEDKHAPGAHMSFTRGLQGGTTCPKLLVGQGPARVVVGKDSNEILVYADKRITKEEDRLYPSDPEEHRLVQSWESKFDDQLGPHVRRYAYCHLLFMPSTYKLLTQGSSTTEKAVVWFMMPFLRRLLYRRLGCSKPGNKEKSLQVVESIFKEVDDVLADGRPYICGSKFTAADLTFAALGGPLIAPPQSGAWGVPLDECPTELATTMKRLQVTPAGKHILKTYETKRRRPEEKTVY